jgi:hypothetical protein
MVLRQTSRRLPAAADSGQVDHFGTRASRAQSIGVFATNAVRSPHLKPALPDSTTHDGVARVVIVQANSFEESFGENYPAISPFDGA